MSFAIVSARRVMTLWFLSARRVVGRQMTVEAVCVMPVSLFLLETVVGCGEDAGETGQQDGWNYALVKQRQEAGSSRRCSEVTDDMDVLIKTEFIVCNESMISVFPLMEVGLLSGRS